MIKHFSKSFTFFLFLALFGCQTAANQKTENSIPRSKPDPVAAQTTGTNNIDVPKLADKAIVELDAVFGKPDESKPVEDGGEYRLYRTANQSKGLAVRFFDGKAKSFNLILDQPVPTSKEALRLNFGIDVGNSRPTKDPRETLSEKYQGTFNGVKFSKVSAKRREIGKGFIFVLAEVAE